MVLVMSSSTKAQSEVSKLGGDVPVHDIDGRRAGIGEQRRPLEGALAAAHDEYPSVAEMIEPRERAGVRPGGLANVARTTRELRETVRCPARPPAAVSG